MSQLQKKTLTTKRSLNYTYYVSPKSEAALSNPALFFVHGFPDSHHLWTDVIANLTSLPYRFVVPDCLGYGATDKPLDKSLYSYSGMANDLVDILEAEDIKDVIIIGHDWGSVLAQRFYLHHPELCSGVVLMNVAY